MLSATLDNSRDSVPGQDSELRIRNCRLTPVTLDSAPVSTSSVRADPVRQARRTGNGHFCSWPQSAASRDMARYASAKSHTTVFGTRLSTQLGSRRTVRRPSADSASRVNGSTFRRCVDARDHQARPIGQLGVADPLKRREGTT